MDRLNELKKIKEVYSRGGNIIQYLKDHNDQKQNSIDEILISYDFQAGSYIKNFSVNREYFENYSELLAKEIELLVNEFDSIIEVGVGEATTLSSLLYNLKSKPSKVFGFDISWSRLKFAKELLIHLKLPFVKLFTANLFEIPLKDCAIDIVYTSHSIEPNGGKEEEALKELYRITKKYLILLEPAFELANQEAQSRMIENGYVTNLYSTAVKLGYKIITHRLFEISSNPLNPTGLLIIEKENIVNSDAELVCPVSKGKLNKYETNFLYSEEGMLTFPIIKGIPCLLRQSSVLTTHFLSDFESYKKENDINI
jgi:ubiquinone/menaquinone biosynthesis C-methylase UbiE/uncharacterized protein YbaR (Trm112 family)